MLCGEPHLNSHTHKRISARQTVRLRVPLVNEWPRRETEQNYGPSCIPSKIARGIILY